jgi:hypothetical protein
VLWIGPASSLEASPLAASPLVDIAWSRELADALALPLASFDCVVLHAGPADAGARLRAAGARAVLETDDPSRGPRPADLAAASRLGSERPGRARRQQPASSARARRSGTRSRWWSARKGVAPPSC